MADVLCWQISSCRRIGLIAGALLLAACSVKSVDESDIHSTSIDAMVVSPVAVSSPDDWHRLALYGNWDFIDSADWRTIVTDPNCDLATALAIFWKASPEYYVEFTDRASVPAINRDGYDLINLIRERWQTNAYTRSELAFDPDTDAWPLDFAELRRRQGDRVDLVMPAGMRVKLNGRRLSSEGFSAPGVLRSG